MTYTKRLSAYQWNNIYNFLKDCKGIYARDEEATCKFVEAVLWVLRSGSQWRLLCSEYGNWNTIYKRFAHWAQKGIWYKMFYYFSDDADMEYIMIDSTTLRAHACASGGLKKMEIKNLKL